MHDRSRRFLSRFLLQSFRRTKVSQGFLSRLTICSVVVASAVAAFAQTPNKVYFSDDFENGASKWEASSGTWGLITTDFRSTSHSISASPGQNYAPNANSILAIPPTDAIDLSNATHPYLSFWHKYSIASACLGGPIYCTWEYDYGYVEVSTNYGVAWTQIASFTGEITSWTPQELDLTPYIGNKILVRFRLWDGGFGAESWGWFLDDIEVREKGPLTVGVTVSVSPSGGGTVTGNGVSCPGTCAETFPSNWNLSGRDWALIDTDYETPPASISASPNGNYALYANSTLELANAVDISTATAPALSYWDKYSIASSCLGGPIYCYWYYDYGYVEVSQDYGVTWTQLTKTTGLVSSWTPETVDLTPYITGGPILIRFRLWDGGYGNVGWGWEVDDIEITDLPTGTVYFSDDFSSPTSVPDFSDVTLTATPSPGYALPTWTGCNSTDDNQCIINEYIDRVVIATFTLAPAPTISFTVPNQTYGTAPFTVAATSNSAGAFTYTVVSGPATIVGATVTLTGAGTVVLQASQAASSNYAAGTKQAAFTVINPGVTFSPTSVAFDNREINTPSVAKNVFLTSSGTTNLIISGITITGTNAPDFSETNTCTASSYAPGAKCTISVKFTPSMLAAESASLVVTDNASNSPQTVPLTGTGVMPVVLSPTSLSFGNLAESEASASKIITLTNYQQVELTGISVSTGSADYPQTNTCGTSVAAGKTCKITINFKPSIVGADDATLTVTDSASNSPQTAALTGTGELPVTLSPATLAFGDVDEGVTSAGKTVTVTNNQNVTLTGIKVSTTSTDYTETNTCGTSLAAGKKCTITVTFKPSIVGTDDATLSVADSASNSPQTAAMTGKGATPVGLTPASTIFATRTVGTTSLAKVFTLSSYLETTLTGIVISTTGDFAVSSTTCTTTLAAKAKCTIDVTFKPTQTGARTGTLKVSDSAANSPQSSTLTGAGK